MRICFDRIFCCAMCFFSHLTSFRALFSNFLFNFFSFLEKISINMCECVLCINMLDAPCSFRCFNCFHLLCFFIVFVFAISVIVPDTTCALCINCVPATANHPYYYFADFVYQIFCHSLAVFLIHSNPLCRLHRDAALLQLTSWTPCKRTRILILITCSPIIVMTVWFA